jgi:hypothetical protein
MAEVTKLAAVANGLVENVNTSTSDLDVNSLWIGGTSGTGATQLTKTLLNTIISEAAAAISSLTGDVSGSGPGAAAVTISAGAVTLSKMAALAPDSIIGNNTSSSATPLALTEAEVTAMLDVFTSSLQGLVPASGGGTTNFLRADGTWATPPSSGGTVTSVALADASTAPIYTVSGSPVTSSGTLAITLNTQSANTALAGPTSGSAAQPTFRALIPADMPELASTTPGSAGSTFIGDNNSYTNFTPSAATVKGALQGIDTALAGVSGSAITALTGDGTATGPGSVAFTLATVNSNVGSFGSSTSIPSFTVNAKGLVTAASSNVVIAPAGTLTGTTLASNVIMSSLTTLGVQAQALNMGSFQINDLAAPSISSDAATKGYVDASINGLTWQGPAQAYANVNVPLTGSTPLVIDGYTVLNGNLVLLSAQTIASQNGEYSVAISGSTYTLTANGLPTVIGDAWLITNGTEFADSAFTATAVVPAAEFIQFAGPTALSYTPPLSIIGNTVSISQATTTTNGFLTSTDWNTFNNKQPAGSYITALTGDVTASGPGSSPATIASIQGTTVAGTTGSGDVVFSASPTLTGTLSGASASFSGSLLAPSLAQTMVAGQAFSANTSYLVRMGITANSETADQVYSADSSSTAALQFWVIGMASSPTAVSPGGSINVTMLGTYTLGSADTGFTAGTEGQAVWLNTSGTFSTVSPSASGSASFKVGTVQTTGSGVLSSLLINGMQFTGGN